MTNAGGADTVRAAIEQRTPPDLERACLPLAHLPCPAGIARTDALEAVIVVYGLGTSSCSAHEKKA